nr:MAG TPA: hypothetical protein [Caudoviricetes sp.]
MGITRHKYDFLDVLAAHAPIVCCWHLDVFISFSVHFTFALI